MDKPDALRLAESAHLGYRIGWQRLAAAELRRLSAVEAQRDALLEALEFCAGTSCATDANDVARAAIKAVEGKKE